MDWDELLVALLEFVGHPVSVDVLVTGTPIPIAGFDGVLANVTQGYEEGRPNDLVSIAIRVKTPPDAERAAYAHIFRPWFQGATRATLHGRDGLSINVGSLNVRLALAE